MSYQQEEKLVRIRVKEGAHENTKVNKDGYKSCLQFDENNGMQGPLEFREVDIEDLKELLENELPSKDIPTSEHTKHDILVDDIFVPVLEAILPIVLDKVEDCWKTTVWPKVKEKTSALKGWILKKIRKDSKEESVIQVAKSKVSKQTRKTQDTSSEELKPSTVVYHTADEVERMVKMTYVAAVSLARAIKELSNTVVIYDGTDPERIKQLQADLDRLSTDSVMNFIGILLEDPNRAQLDAETVYVLQEFKNRNLIIAGMAVPIQKYLLDRCNTKV